MVDGRSADICVIRTRFYNHIIKSNFGGAGSGFSFGVTGFCLSFGVAGFFFGVPELSSVFLAFVDLFKGNHELRSLWPNANEAARNAFRSSSR